MKAEYGSDVRGKHFFQVTSVRLTPQPMLWWRTRKLDDFGRQDVRAIRQALFNTQRILDNDWLPAISGDSAAAIGVAIKALRSFGMTNPQTDEVMSAVVCCAIEEILQPKL